MNRARGGYDRFSPLPRDIPIGKTVYRVWQPPDLDALIDVEAFERDERIPYWANVWESAIVLAEEVAGLDGQGRSFLELGCGIGLPAIVAAGRGFAATATDYEEDALQAVRFNADRNGAAALVSRLVDWRNPPDDLGRFDHVVAADVLYENHHAEALAAMIARTLAPHGVAWVTDPGRAKAAGFEPAARAAGLGVARRPARRPHGATEGPEIDLYVVTRPA
ncbi:MAG: class I SAM-dependent methyltransferase [Planctomycetia bacterium]